MGKHVLLGICLLLVCWHTAFATQGNLHAELEQVLKQRAYYVRQKEARIDSLKQELSLSANDIERIRLYNSIYEEYYTFRFDSAMQYVDKLEEEAIRLSDASYYNLSVIYRSVLLSTSGYFSESIENLQKVDRQVLDTAQWIKYYAAYE